MVKKKIKRDIKKEPVINKDYIKICPNCGSKDIRYYTDDYRRQYICNICSYFANEFPEIKRSQYNKFVSKLKKIKTKKTKKVI